MLLYLFLGDVLRYHFLIWSNCSFYNLDLQENQGMILSLFVLSSHFPLTNSAWIAANWTWMLVVTVREASYDEFKEYDNTSLV